MFFDLLRSCNSDTIIFYNLQAAKSVEKGEAEFSVIVRTSVAFCLFGEVLSQQVALGLGKRRKIRHAVGKDQEKIMQSFD